LIHGALDLSSPMRVYLRSDSYHCGYRITGQSPLGEQRIVPITGGTFLGDKLRGTVLAGDAERQLIRADGVKELDALYEMRTHGGVVITVHNQVTIDFPNPDTGSKRYAFSTVKLTAPQGPYDWLNKRVFVWYYGWANACATGGLYSGVSARLSSHIVNQSRAAFKNDDTHRLFHPHPRLFQHHLGGAAQSSLCAARKGRYAHR
jgi:Protein of unknown function (DUF3237)